MRKAAAPVAANKASFPVGGRDERPAKVVCLAPALLALASRIASIW